jgi:D-3-phosphoglycerate dehydrogenase
MTLRALNVEPARYDADARGVLARAADVDYVECADQAAFVAALGRAPYRALFVRLGVAVDEAALAAAPGLRWIVTPTTGLDHIDGAAAEKRGVRTISLRGETAFLEGIRSTAEHTWALLLALVRLLPSATSDVLAGQWRREPHLADELSGKTLGIVGLGRLGRMVAGYGVAFHMRVLAYDHDPAASTRAPAGVEAATLDAGLAASDVLSLHLPLDSATKGFLSRERLAQLRPGARLVNTARGELVDEAALLDALRAGRLAGAAVDVLAGDGRWDHGVPDAHPLVAYARDHSQLLITPHTGGYARHAILGTRRFVAERFVQAAQAAGEAT